jgi:hypothetical protein
MKTFQVTLWLYRTALERSWRALRNNLVVTLAPLAYGIILTVCISLIAPLGIIGGFIYSLVSAACASSGLFLIRNLVENGKADFNAFLNGFTVFIWDVVTIAFILWIPMRVAEMGLSTVPNGALLYFLFRLGIFIVLNAVPELIYQIRASGLELIGASYNFIVENWLEWLVPNVLCVIIGFYLLDLIDSLTFALPAFAAVLVHMLFLGFELAYFMVFRGFLFAELYGTTRRSRVYRYNTR